MLGFEDLRIGDFAYIRDDLECGKSYGSKTFVGGSQGMKKGVFLEIFNLKPDCIGNDIFLYSKEMIDLSKSMKRTDYFKKKEQSQYTFDDLIRTARKAFDDGVLRHLFQSIDPVREPQITTQDGVCVEWVDNLNDYKASIDFIQSLYKETFTIESEEDLKRVKSNPKITLNNGEVVLFTFKETAKDHLIFYDQACGHNLIPFVFLKGATVEQERGRDD